MATRHSNSFRVPTATVASGSDANFNKDNVLLYTRPNRVWKSSAAITVAGAATGNTNRTYVGLDLGSALALVSIFVDNINITSVLVQHSSDGTTWTTDSTATVMRNGDDGRYKFWLALTSWTFRYIRLNANTTSTTDGQTLMQVGSIVVQSATTTWSTPGGLPFIRTPLQASITNADGISGGRDPVLTGNRYSLLTVNQPAMPMTMEDTILELLGYGMHAPFLFIRDDTDATLTEQAYIVRRVSTPGIEKLSPAHFSLSGLLLEGVV